MAKSTIKRDLKKRENDIDDLIMLEDSTRGTLCAIHQTINSSENFPRSKHQIIKVCTAPKSHCDMSCTRIQCPGPRSRRKSRSNSPSKSMGRALSASDPYRNYCRMESRIHPKVEVLARYKTVVQEQRNHQPSAFITVGKTLSCPEKMCCSKNSNKTSCSFTSRSSIQVDQYHPSSLLNADEVVNELKGEIEKVKSQLYTMALQRANAEYANTKMPKPIKPRQMPMEDFDEAQITKLKTENKRRELEAKKKMLEKSKKDVTKAKDILTDYERKVNLLHVQALKSSKAMKVSKEKFCNCLKEREEKIRSLEQSNAMLEQLRYQKNSVLTDREEQLSNLKLDLENMKSSLEETSLKCSELSKTNQSYLESMEMLRGQLKSSSAEVDSQRSVIQVLEQKSLGLNCLCNKMFSKLKKQKENFEVEVKKSEEEKGKLTEEIAKLSEKLQQMEGSTEALGKLQCQCENLQKKVEQYELFGEKCKMMEEECKQREEQLLESQSKFDLEKKEMERLIKELSNVVKDNKSTIFQMAEINKKQESLIQSQSIALMSKEEQLKEISEKSEDFKLKAISLENEVQELKKSISGPCQREACLCISRELSEIKNALNEEKDTQRIKEKIIEDQSQTIINLQSQVKEKVSELKQAHSDTQYLEEEIGKINEKLYKKHQELDQEIREKEDLMEKLTMLEGQKTQLLDEINEFEEMLHQYKDMCGDNESKQDILRNVEQQIIEQKREWDSQKESMAKEKKKAVCAAKFATQKLFETIADFQRQVEAQRKVQILLTKMLHEKDEQLRVVNSKISNIKHITKDISEPRDMLMKELFFSDNLRSGISSKANNTENASMYSSCSSCCRKSECSRISHRSTKCDSYYDSYHGRGNIQKIQEEPSKDM
ncbi:myosin-4-like isoform X3 [Anthonomus grandis grandis]|uniref:myosin-4-like isoform X3 n=1 Tax=Anthonomus grandis grandis TaxID=2921223 RepID=UPI0021663572|nr:myosin-4-like isoform X3 [Anthonomus grandis grandis]